MKKPKHVTRLVPLLIASSILLVWAKADEALGKADDWVQVTKVVDGDTIYVGKRKVRLKCIDTPETVDTHKPVECFGPQASNFTTDSLMDKRVRLELDPVDSKQHNQDFFRRKLAYVFLEDGTFFNLELARQGYGRTMRYPCSHKDEFQRAEKEAREAGRGLWGECECVGKIMGDMRTLVYHRPDQRRYDISPENRKCFDTEEEARAEGLRPSER
ncbi:MAG: thermonuclease family protein [Candidatus Binatia bacterium]|jgi:micrococcal nuclease